MADAPDLGSGMETCESSSLSVRTLSLQKMALELNLRPFFAK